MVDGTRVAHLELKKHDFRKISNYSIFFLRCFWSPWKSLSFEIFRTKLIIFQFSKNGQLFFRQKTKLYRICYLVYFSTRISASKRSIILTKNLASTFSLVLQVLYFIRICSPPHRAQMFNSVFLYFLHKFRGFRELQGISDNPKSEIRKSAELKPDRSGFGF